MVLTHALIERTAWPVWKLCSCHGDDVCQNLISTQDTSDSDSE